MEYLSEHVKVQSVEINYGTAVEVVGQASKQVLR